MSDLSVTVGGDFSELLQGFKQLEQQAKASGESVGKGIAEGIQGYSTRSLTALQAELNRLQSRQAKVAVDSSAFEKAGQKIKEIQALISEVERRRLSIGVDDRSINALNAKLGTLQQELGKVAIGSQRFKELQDAIQSTERELAKAGQAADGFNLIDGAIQGLAFSLTNTVTNAAASALQAIGGLISGFAELDTEIRQAAAASGESGGYDKIARSIDQVGIEAAGTQMEVAQLATELIRGGMSVDQMNASLGAIVRGAEATGTGFAQMGSVVSASLKGFGLEAKDSTRVVDALVTGANASATSVEGMGMAFKYAAPVARILGVSVEELGIAVGLLTNAGIDASEAGVTLRNGLSKLASAAPQTGGSMQKLTGQAKMAADSMKQLGINIYNADGTLQPMGTTLLKLKGAFDKLGPSSKIRLAANLFGGEDDGTKWLALLNQSEAEIRKMSTTMANTKGATDTARDAMQGFKMAMTQLTGTLDSLGKTLGGVAATALKPLVDMANMAVGVIAGLPTPVKATGAALILLTGATVAATAAMVIFQRTMQVTAIQTAAAEIKALAVALVTNLKGAATVGIVAVDGLLAQLIRIGKVDIIAKLSALATTLKASVVAGFSSAAAAARAFAAAVTSGSLLAGIKALGVSLWTALAPFLPFIAAVAALVAAWKLWESRLSEASKVSEGFNEKQQKINATIRGLNDALGENSKKIEDSSEGIAKWWRDGKVAEGLNRMRADLEKLQEGYDKVEKGALAFYATIKNVKTLNEGQRQEAEAYLKALESLKDTYKENAAQARALAEAQRKAGNPEIAAQAESAARKYDVQAQAMGNLAQAYKNKISPQQKSIDQSKKEIAVTDEQKKAIQELNKVIAEAPVRNLEAQLAIGQQLLSLTNAIAEREQSRFGVTKAALQFELKALQDRGAGESVIAAKKAQIDQTDRASLSARYQALLQQQALEQAMLRLSQEKARTEANLAVKQQEIKLLEEEIKLRDLGKNASQEDRDLAQVKINLQKEILGISQEQVGILDKTQPLERATVAATAEAARNGLKMQAAAEGYAFAADGSLVKTQGIASSLRNVAVFTDQSATAQERYRQMAEQSGLAIGKAADGSVVLGKSQQEVNKAVGDLNRELGNAATGYNNTASAAGGAKTETQLVEAALKSAGLNASDLSEGLKQGEGSAINAKSAADGLGKSLAQGKAPAGDIANAFTSIGNKAPATVQGARDFAGFLARAKDFAEKIANLNLGSRMTAVSNATRAAAEQAKSFYNWLLQASNLPGSRWTGGPVEAGSEYRINELGQEAFLSAGRLSMIQAPANAVWRAPSAGVVIPAGITARLQDAGALPSPGGIAAVGGNAELAIEIGKLRQEVGELARKQWNISVTQRTGPTGSQVLRTLQQLR